MRSRVAALVLLSGMVVIPAVAGAAAPRRTTTVSASVRPRSGSARTHFKVSFRAALSTGPTFHNVYRVTANDATHRGCQSAVSAAAPPTRAGSTVRVVLAPSTSKRWCAGTFHGQVWDEIIESCPVGKACPAIEAIEPLPRKVGTFTFRVTRG